MHIQTLNHDKIGAHMGPGFLSFPTEILPLGLSQPHPWFSTATGRKCSGELMHIDSPWGKKVYKSALNLQILSILEILFSI